MTWHSDDDAYDGDDAFDVIIRSLASGVADPSPNQLPIILPVNYKGGGLKAYAAINSPPLVMLLLVCLAVIVLCTVRRTTACATVGHSLSFGRQPKIPRETV